MTKNMVPGESVYNEKRVSVEVRIIFNVGVFYLPYEKLLLGCAESIGNSR